MTHAMVMVIAQQKSHKAIFCLYTYIPVNYTIRTTTIRTTYFQHMNSHARLDVETRKSVSPKVRQKRSWVFVRVNVADARHDLGLTEISNVLDPYSYFRRKLFVKYYSIGVFRKFLVNKIQFHQLSRELAGFLLCLLVDIVVLGLNF